MNVRHCLPVAVLLAAASGPGGAAVGPALTVIRSDVRFAGEGDAYSRVSLWGDLTVGPRLADLDPLADPLYVRVGTLVLLDGPAPVDDTRIRVTGDEWRIEYRGAPANPGRVSLRLAPGTGRFTLKAKGVAAGALREAGAAGVAVQLVAGGEDYATSVDFEEKDEQRWCYRIPPGTGRPPPGGGGGGTLPGGIVALGQGDVSGITTLRFEVVRDDAAWASLWLEHAGGGAPPAVDLSREMVVGLWLGARPTGGYAVEILRMIAPYTLVVGGWCPPCPDGYMCPGAPCFGGSEVQGFLVDARETRPGTGCVVTQAVTYPFVIVKLPRVEGAGTYSYVLATRNCP